MTYSIMIQDKRYNIEAKLWMSKQEFIESNADVIVDLASNDPDAQDYYDRSVGKMEMYDDLAWEYAKSFLLGNVK